MKRLGEQRLIKDELLLNDKIMANWYDNQIDLLEFAKYLHDKDEFDDADAVIYFFEKPWKWNEKLKEYQNEKKINEKIKEIEVEN